MADSVTGVGVFTLTELSTISDPVNTTLGGLLDSEGDAIVLRSRWDSVATVIASDAPGDLGDGNERVHYVSKSLGAPWYRQDAKPGINDDSFVIVPAGLFSPMQDVTVMAGNGVDSYASIPTFSPVAFEYSAWVNREVYTDSIRFFGNTADVNGRLAAFGSQSSLYLDDSSGTRIGTPADTLITGQDQYVQVQVLADGSAWIKVDGVVVATGAAGTLDGLGWGIDSIGRQSAKYAGDSVTITNQVFKDLDTGLTRTYNNTDNYERIGSNLVDAGTYQKTSSDSLEIPVNVPLIIGQVYRVSIKYDNNNSVPSLKLGSAAAPIIASLLPSVTGEVFSAEVVCTDNSVQALVITGATAITDVYEVSLETATVVLPDSSDNYLAFGSELVTNGDFSAGVSGWSTTTSSSIITDGGGFLKAEQIGTTSSWMARDTRGNLILVAGATYTVSGTIWGEAGNSSTGPTISLWDENNSSTIVSGNEAQFAAGITFVAPEGVGAVGVILKSGDSSIVGDIFYLDDVSVKKTTLVPQDYAGKNPSNLVTNGNFAYTTDWSYALNGGTASMSNGKLTLVRADGNDASVNQVVTGFVIGQRYIVSLDVLSTVGSNKVSLFGGVLPYATSTGLRTVEVEATSTSATLNIQKGGLSGSHAVFNSISVKHVDDVTDGAWVNATIDDLVYLP